MPSVVLSMKTRFDWIPELPMLALILGEFIPPRPVLSFEPSTLRWLIPLLMWREPESPLPPPEVMAAPELELGWLN